jgi:signal transduction histidine kinase/tetratricopeptide (TPR) repeat protein
MRTSCLTILFFATCANAVVAQPLYSKADSTAIFSLIDKAELFYTNGNNDSALLYCKKAENLSKSKKNYSGEAWALIKATEILIQADQLNKAGENTLLVNELGARLKDSLITAISFLQRAQVKMYMNQYDTAIMLFDKGLRYKLNSAQNKYTALAYNDLGFTWGNKQEYEKQAEYTVKALNIYEKLKNDGGMAMALGNLSTVYYTMGQKEKAIEYGKQCLQYREKTGDIGKISLTCCNLSQYYLGVNAEEATKYQQLCVKYAVQSGNEDRMIHSYITSSLLANNKKNNKEALDYELKVIELLEKSKGNQKMLARRYIAAAFLNDMLKLDSLTTLNYFNRSITLSLEMNDRNNLKDVYSFMSNYYNRKKNYEDAYKSYKKHILYKDSISNTDKEALIADIGAKYETEKKDKEIIRLNTAQQIRQLEIEKQKAIISGNTAAALQKQNEIDLLSKSRELQDAKISQQEEELVKKELIATANRQQLELSEKEKQLQHGVIKNQKTLKNLLLAGLALFLLLGYTYFNRYQLKKKLEQQNSLLAMRNNISQDLHDDIGASLSSINILNELARRNSSQPEKSKEYLSKASEDIQRISESLSDIVWNINPRYDDLQNLFVRMKRYAADMLDGKNINGHFDFPADENSVQLSMTQRRDLYLIFKEAINNLVKYSGAKEALVSLKAGKHKITMQVKDDGKGFDKQLIKTGNGLQNMEQRAKASGGFLNIQSAPGKGTVLEMEMEVIPNAFIN